MSTDTDDAAAAGAPLGRKPLIRFASYSSPKQVLFLGSKDKPFKLGRQTIVFSTSSSSYFADIIARELQVARGVVERGIKPGGERTYRLDIPDRQYLMGKDTIYVGSLASDEDLLEMYRVGCQLAMSGTSRRVFLIPFFGYSTSNRQHRPGDVVCAKIHSLMLSSIPSTGLGNTFVFFDMHFEGLVHNFEGSCLRMELSGQDLLADAIKLLDLKDFMFGTTDFGQPKRVEKFAAKFGTDIAFMRVGLGEARDHEIVGEVKGRKVIIYDDMICTGKRMLMAAESYLANGATEVYAVVSHLGLSDEEAARRLLASPLRKIVATNSHPMSQCPSVQLNPDRFVLLDVTPLFTDVVLVHNLCRV